MRLRPRHALFALAAVVVLLVIPVPPMGRTARAFNDLAHVPVGVVVALAAFILLQRRMPRSRFAAVVVAGVLSVGLLLVFEVMQPFVGRSRSKMDLLLGGLGAAGTLSLVLAWGRPVALRLLLGLVGVASFAAACVPTGRILADVWRQGEALPILASFEDDLELTRWRFNCATGTRDGAHATHGLWSLRVDLDVGRYPGAMMHEPYADWSGYRVLALDLLAEGDEPLELILQIADADHDQTWPDRFHRTLALVPGAHEVRVRLEDVRQAPRDRTMDLSRIRGVQLFVDGLSVPRTFHVDAIRLVR